MRVYAEGRQGRWLILPFLLILSPLSVMGRKKIDVFVAGFFPVGEGPKHSLGRGVMPALNLAVKHVNDHPTVLRNYKLHVIWNDTQCDTAVGTKLFFDMMYNKPAKLMLFGAACTHVTNPIAKAAKHWHIVQLSYADTHPMFNAIKYPNFFRMVPSDREFNHPRVHLLQRYNWTRVGTLFQNEPRHALAHNHLASMLEENSYQIEVTQNIADELKDQLKRLHEKDVRVILGYFDEHWARRIFCEAYRKGMYGKNYQWIITGMYREEWWALRGTGEEDEDAKPIVFEDEPRESGGGGCAVEDIMTALEGCIMTDLLPLSSSLERTVSGKNISEYEREYDSMRRSEYSRFHGYTYDGVWAMALAIQAVGHQLHRINHQNRTNLTVQDFTYRNPKWEELFTKALSEVKFEGVTGPVQFSSDNTRDGYILLKQFQGGREVKIGEFDGFRNVLQMDKGHPIYWPGGDPPLDRTVKLIEKTSVNITIYAILVTIASLGIVMASIFLAINIKYRNQRYIKMSSPYLNNVIIVGCILTYSSVILLGLDSGLASETSFPYICTARAWVLMAGFTLAFGSMFSKTWRVHSIFTDVQLNKKVIKDSQLFMVVLVLLCVDVAIMTTWQVVDPFYRETKKMAPFMRGDIEVTPENEYCKSNKISVFIGCIYAYKGLLMVFGCFLAWETRQVNIPALNDSKYIGMSVYNVVIMCVIGAPISYILSDEQDSSYLIISIFIIFCTTGTLTLVFVPKIIELRRNPQGNINQRLVRPTLKPPKSQDSDSELSDLHEQIKKAESDRQVFARRLHEREQELQILIDQLGEDALGEVETHPSRTSTRRPSKPRSIDRLRIEGPSITETTEATELTSLCSGGSHELEYVTARHKIPPHQLHPTHQPHSTSTTTITTTTTTAHHLLHHPHQPLPPPHYQASLPAHYMHGLPPPATVSYPPPPLTSSTSASTSVSTYASLDRALLRHDLCDARRGVTFASPVQTPREVSKSVSFRLEGGVGVGVGGQETIPLHPLGGGLPPQPPGPSPTPPLQMPPTSAQGGVMAYQAAPQEAPPATYGGVYVHDYGGAMMQKEQRLLQQRRSSRTSLGGRRYSREEADPGPPQETAPQPPILEYAGGEPLGGMGVPLGGRGRGVLEPYRRSSLRRGVGGEEGRGGQGGGQGGMPPPHHDPVTHYNISGEGPPPYRPPPMDAPRRGSEPPRPAGRGAPHRNRSCDDLACSCCEAPLPPHLLDRWEGEEAGRGEDREGTRTISRAHLRRDSFGEVVARRSPSQDSLDHAPPAPHAPHARSPPLLLDDPTPLTTPTPPPHVSGGRRSPSQDSYGYGAPPRRTDSQDSLDQQVCGRGRAASQESLGTMSSRGSVCGSLYSVASARSDAAVSRCSSKETVRNHAPLTQQTLPHPRGHSHSNYMNEPPGLHRTISEPYNFDDDDERSLHNASPPHRIYQASPAPRPVTNTRRLPPVRTPSYDIYDANMSGFHTHSLRGRGRHATTTSVAAAIAAVRKNASDNALDHDTSILPIFQKLLSERQRGYGGSNREFTMSSCPNITIKCDIVEYL